MPTSPFMVGLWHWAARSSWGWVYLMGYHLDVDSHDVPGMRVKIWGIIPNLPYFPNLNLISQILTNFLI